VGDRAANRHQAVPGRLRVFAEFETHKNDAADVEAICEAVSKPNMRFPRAGQRPGRRRRRSKAFRPGARKSATVSASEGSLSVRPVHSRHLGLSCPSTLSQGKPPARGMIMRHDSRRIVARQRCHRRRGSPGRIRRDLSCASIAIHDPSFSCCRPWALAVRWPSGQRSTSHVAKMLSELERMELNVAGGARASVRRHP
jgi:hypothetical protein